nr:NADH dehydrogenase subunit 6 [Nipponacmea sp. JM-2022]
MGLVQVLFAAAVSVAATLPFMSTPYALGSSFMIVLFLISVFLMSVGPLWYPAAMFLVYVGAVMVLFLYMSCLSPNMRIKGPSQSMVRFVTLATITIVAVVSSDYAVIQTSISESSEAMNQIQCPSEMSSLRSGDSLVFCGVLLFISLLSVVKICKHQKGALRPFKRSLK